MKRPSFQFYPSDWRKDASLQSCSMAAQGMWINALCIAHECEPYGHLTLNGKAMNAAQLARLIGLGAKECTTLLTELAEAGVTSIADTGAIYSRRLVRDEEVRNLRTACGQLGAEHGVKGAKYGAKGGRPRTFRGVSETPLEPPPSSSSSSSPSGGENALARDPPPILGISSEQKAWAATERPDIDVDAVAENFLAYHSAKGSTPDDAAWRKWVRKEHPARVNGNAVVAPSITVPSDEAARTSARLAAQAMSDEEKAKSETARVAFLARVKVAA